MNPLLNICLSLYRYLANASRSENGCSNWRVSAWRGWCAWRRRSASRRPTDESPLEHLLIPLSVSGERLQIGKRVLELECERLEGMVRMAQKKRKQEAY